MGINEVWAPEGGASGKRRAWKTAAMALLFLLLAGCVTTSSSSYSGVGWIPYRTIDDQDVLVEYEYEFTHNPPDIDRTTSLGRQFTDLLAETASIQISNAISAFFVRAFREYTLAEIVEASRSRRGDSTVHTDLAAELETEVVFEGLVITSVRIAIGDD